MTLTPKNADDSCLINQTVPAEGGLFTSSPVHLDEKSQLPNINPNSGGGPEDQTGHSHPVGNATAGVASSSSSSLSNGDDEDEFPEGGLEAWLIVLGSFCAMMSVYGLINVAAVFESYFSTNQLVGYNSSTIGWIFSVYLFIVFFAGIQVGAVFDRYGPRWLVAVEYYQILLAYSVLGGLGGALLNVPAYGVIAHFFKERRGFATGIAATSGSVGGIVFPIFMQAVIPKLGFAWTTRIIGFILLFLSVIANLLVRSRLPPSIHPLRVLPDWSLFRDLKFTFCCAGIWFMEWGIFTPLTYIVSYAAAHGQNPNDAYTLLALLCAGSFFGRFLPGFLADRFGRFNVITLTNALCVITILAFWLPAGNSHSMLLAFAITFGFASGSNLGLYPVCIGQLCDARDYGRFFSTAMMVGSFGTLSSLPIAGALLGVGKNEEQGWLALILFAALSYFIAMSCFLGARVLAVSWGVKKVY
ncbi:MFS general substrate transporter [Hypoxylon trugodes]|uniref:MFS general substrate transporter n=1 Tax=Hypoxylon trugodes TaxID=326681 RepID=UPI00218D35F3|nr:MFS general substrate transporter [Hypoxylon trugodes]KAI1394198.1 MFS general substrate transporter [Hypoxylon trugodes]